MKVEEMIKALEEMGFKVSARKRTDGGMIISKIDNMTFTGAKGNQYARQVLGVELSQARIEQTHFNVQKYIAGAKKKTTLDEEMKKKLRKVQRQWRKNEVHGRITAKKVKWHLEHEGRKAAEANLEKMSRYGQGYAYYENVEYLAKYIEDVGRGILTDDDLQDRVFTCADYVRSKAETFKEEWISKVYEWWYDAVKFHYDENVVDFAINLTYNLIG